MASSAIPGDQENQDANDIARSDTLACEQNPLPGISLLRRSNKVTVVRTFHFEERDPAVHALHQLSGRRPRRPGWYAGYDCVNASVVPSPEQS